MKEISKADPIQIARRVFDEESDSNRVKLVETEMAIELSAEDGDSVLAVHTSLVLQEGIHSVAGMKTLCLYGSATLSVSPHDEGEEFYSISPAETEPKTICARRLKIEGTGTVVVQSV